MSAKIYNHGMYNDTIISLSSSDKAGYYYIPLGDGYDFRDKGATIVVGIRDRTFGVYKIDVSDEEFEGLREQYGRVFIKI